MSIFSKEEIGVFLGLMWLKDRVEASRSASVRARNQKTRPVEEPVCLFRKWYS